MTLPGPKILIACGVAIIAAGFAYDMTFAGLPYQDPTPELYASWSFHSGFARAIQSVGALLLAVGIVFAIARFVWISVFRSREP